MAETAPCSGAEARLLVVMVTLRTAQSGVGNLVGQDIKGLPLSDPERLVGAVGGVRLARHLRDRRGTDRLPPENPTQITVPSLTPD